MILNYSIQQINSGNLLLAVAFQNLNKTEVFDFFDSVPELSTEVEDINNDTCIFYIEDSQGVVFERYIDSPEIANEVKNKLIDFIAHGKSKFSVLKEKFLDYAKAASYAVHR